MKEFFIRRLNAIGAKKLSCKRGGFTLVEVIVTLVITVIVVAVSSSLVITGTNIFARSAQRDVQQNIAETVLTFVSDQLLYARIIGEGAQSPVYPITNKALLHIVDPKTGTGSDRGYLFFRRHDDSRDSVVNVFGDNFYQNYTVGLKIDIAPGDAGNNASFTLTVTVYNSTGTAVTTRTTAKPLLNFPTGGSPQNGIGTTGRIIEITPLPPSTP